MTLTFDSKIKELEQSKSELDFIFLENQKKEYEEKMYEILDNQNNEIDETSALSELNKVKSYRTKIKEINHKMQYNGKFLEDIDKKISFYKEKKEGVKDIPLYRDTEEGIAEILGSDPLYQYALESNNEELIKKFRNRSLTPDEYTKSLEKMYKELFSSLLKKKKGEFEAQQPPKVVIVLPEGMSDQINEELKNNKDIAPQDIESFLKKELKKNAGEIKLSHIKNTFKDKFDQAYQYIKRLIINYPGFKIIENQNTKKPVAITQSKRDKLISDTFKVTDEEKNDRIKKELLLSRLSEIGKMEDQHTRIVLYVNIYEEIGCKFTDKFAFLNELHSAITTYNNLSLESEIQKSLTSIIKGVVYPLKLERYGYFAYKLGRACGNWRIIMYPNGEIFKVCSHEEYEKIINRKPPIDKV